MLLYTLCKRSERRFPQKTSGQDDLLPECQEKNDKYKIWDYNVSYPINAYKGERDATYSQTPGNIQTF